MLTTVRMAALLIVALACASSAEAASPAPSAADRVADAFNRATTLAADRNFAAARDELTGVFSLTNSSPAHQSMAQLMIARSFAIQGNASSAIGSYERVSRIAGAPAHHQEEAVREIARLRNQPLPLPATRTLPQVKPAVEFHVSSAGSDRNSGSHASPFATLERARDAIRALKNDRAFADGGVAVIVHGGTYPMERAFELTAEDSGTATAPIIYRSGDDGPPVFAGGKKLKGFVTVKDETILRRLPPEAHGKVMQVNLGEQGITNIWPLQLGGFGSGRGFKTHPVMELFFNDKPLQLARWPNDGHLTITSISTNDGHRIHGLAGSKTGVFEYDSERPLRWKAEKDVRLYGYWFWDWADSYEQVASIDVEKRVITLAPPFHTYGYRKGQRFHALNLLAEIDMPGEWYLDRASRILYLWPPGDLAGARVELSAAPFTFVDVREASHVRFEGITWEMGSADAISVRGGSDVVLAGCTVRRFAGNGILVEGGKRNGVLSSEVYSLGRGGIRLSGGDRKSLTAASNFVENCHIHDLSRVDATYTPAVGVSGVGHRIAHNLMHHIRSSAINLGGNDHLVEFNEAGHVVQESDDQGAVDMYGNPTYRGNVYRWNYFHHIGPWKNARTEPALGQAGIRLDDAICGVLIYGNVFRHAATGKHGFGGVQIHGGKENIVDANLFLDCAQGVSFSPWNEAHWLDYTKKQLQAAEVDMVLYTNRYPQLATLNSDLNVNHLWRNHFVTCDRMLRNNRASKLLANAEETNSARWNELVMRYPAPSDVTAAATIPFTKIGLYRDAWRKEIPVALIGDLRSDR